MKRTNTRLQLNRQTIRALAATDLTQVGGGAARGPRIHQIQCWPDPGAQESAQTQGNC